MALKGYFEFDARVNNQIPKVDVTYEWKGSEKNRKNHSIHYKLRQGFQTEKKFRNLLEVSLRRHLHRSGIQARVLKRADFRPNG